MSHAENCPDSRGRQRYTSPLRLELGRCGFIIGNFPMAFVKGHVMIKVGIVGGTGYTGVELLRLRFSR